MFVARQEPGWNKGGMFRIIQHDMRPELVGTMLSPQNLLRHLLKYPGIAVKIEDCDTLPG